MSLSRQSLEILVDLLEIKINSLHVQDRDDARELNKLRKCRQELFLELTLQSSKRTRRIMSPTAFSERTYRKKISSRR
jgi:hypothetical protein